MSSDSSCQTKIFTLCDSCNKEFEIKYKPLGIVVGYNCPHCGESNSRWLRVESCDCSHTTVIKDDV